MQWHAIIYMGRIWGVCPNMHGEMLWLWYIPNPTLPDELLCKFVAFIPGPLKSHELYITRFKMSTVYAVWSSRMVYLLQTCKCFTVCVSCYFRVTKTRSTATHLGIFCCAVKCLLLLVVFIMTSISKTIPPWSEHKQCRVIYDICHRENRHLKHTLLFGRTKSPQKLMGVYHHLLRLASLM